jgi:hypothetical protein
VRKKGEKERRKEGSWGREGKEGGKEGRKERTRLAAATEVWETPRRGARHACQFISRWETLRHMGMMTYDGKEKRKDYTKEGTCEKKRIDYTKTGRSEGLCKGKEGGRKGCMLSAVW